MNRLDVIRTDVFLHLLAGFAKQQDSSYRPNGTLTNYQIRRLRIAAAKKRIGFGESKELEAELNITSASVRAHIWKMRHNHGPKYWQFID